VVYEGLGFLVVVQDGFAVAVVELDAVEFGGVAMFFERIANPLEPLPNHGLGGVVCERVDKVNPRVSTGVHGCFVESTSQVENFGFEVGGEQWGWGVRVVLFPEKGLSSSFEEVELHTLKVPRSGWNVFLWSVTRSDSCGNGSIAEDGLEATDVAIQVIGREDEARETFVYRGSELLAALL
jgi:hypothetical protein